MNISDKIGEYIDTQMGTFTGFLRAIRASLVFLLFSEGATCIVQGDIIGFATVAVSCSVVFLWTVVRMKKELKKTEE